MTLRCCNQCGKDLFLQVSKDTGFCADCRQVVIKTEVPNQDFHYMSDDGLKILRNPKYAQGIRKFTMCVVPPCVLGEVGVAMTEGAYKYGAYNYRKTKIDASTYYDSTQRHIMSWWEGEDIDPDSGLHHITKAIASLVVLRDSMINNMILDDRPPAANNAWKEGLNAMTVLLHEKYGGDVENS